MTGSRIRVVGDPIPYADGSEELVLSLLAAAEDRSDGSDELEAAIIDWPTRYHLSSQRSNLLRPLRLSGTERVLEIGAGTGALTRFLAERAGSVTAVEGAVARARSVATRCEDLVNVDVVAGDFHAVAEGSDGDFDLVTVVGVLEYSTAESGGGHGPAPLLDAAASLLADDGVLVLAIENQLGLEYLAGAPEDHIGLPWIGVTGYPEPGPMTYSRRKLGSMLDDSGLTATRWLYPFPDYKLPSAILAHDVYDTLAAGQLVDQMVGQVVTYGARTSFVLGDVRAAHRTMVDAGIGPDVSNSFLVVAGRSQAAVDSRIDPTTLAWLFGSPRKRTYRRTRMVTGAGAPEAVTMLEYGGGEGSDWLQHHTVPSRPYLPGASLADVCEAFCRADDEAGLSNLLRRWADSIEEVDAPTSIDHPFADDATTSWASGQFLDIDLGNFVLQENSLSYVDDEWRVADPIDRDLVRFRALWNFARDLVARGARHPWPLTERVDDLALRLAGLSGVPVGESTPDRFRRAERSLQAIVSPLTPAELEGYLDPDRSVAAEFAERRGSLSDALALARKADAARRDAEATVLELQERAVELEAENERWGRAVRLRRVADLAADLAVRDQ